MKRKLGILTVLHMIEGTGLGGNLIFPVRLKEAEAGDLGMAHGDHMIIHILDGKNAVKGIFDIQSS